MVTGMTPERPALSLPIREHPTTSDPLHPRAYLLSYSEIKGLRYCAPRFRCSRALCPSCATARASRARAMIRRAAATMPGAQWLYVRLSLTASSDLIASFDSLTATYREWTHHNPSRNRFTTLEATRSESGSWNLHYNVLVLAPEESAAELLARWGRAADKTSSKTEPAALYAEPVRSRDAVTRYVAKGPLSPARDGSSPSPGDLLRSAVQGDADAAEAWAALESLCLARSVRWLIRSGAFQEPGAHAKPRRPAQTPRPGRARLPITASDLARVAELSSKAAASQLGISESTYKRRKREMQDAP